MHPIIEVHNISKQYRLGTIGTGSMTHDLNRWWHRLRGKEDPYLRIGEANDRSTKGSSEYVWALREISFTVQPGEVLGIIGRNGAGKSTLLKILSRITTPSTGSIKLGGRVASLLEVGTGMHPELTGRENIYLNGAILGMRKKEIDRKLDAIVDFSGVERYLDTPVKRYSSGMHVRLGFAVAAHLEPDILIVDEVLAVGDAEFQQKCLGKMQEVSSNEGRTVLYVSHNLLSLQTLCTSGVLIQQGGLAMQGPIIEVVNAYQRTMDKHLGGGEAENLLSKQVPTLPVLFEGVEFWQNEHITEYPVTGKKTIIRVIIRSTADYDKVAAAIGFFSMHGEAKTIFYSQVLHDGFSIKKGTGYFECHIEKWPFSSGELKYNLLLNTPTQTLNWLGDAGKVTVQPGDFFGKGRVVDKNNVLVYVNHDWSYAAV